MELVIKNYRIWNLDKQAGVCILPPPGVHTVWVFIDYPDDDSDDDSFISSDSSTWSSDSTPDLDDQSFDEINDDDPWIGGRNWLWTLNPILKEWEDRQRAVNTYDDSDDESDNETDDASQTIQNESNEIDDEGVTNGITDYVTLASWNIGNAYREEGVTNLMVKHHLDYLATQEPYMQVSDANERKKWAERGINYVRKHGYEQTFTAHQIITEDQEKLTYARIGLPKVMYDGRIVVSKFRMTNQATLTLIACYNVARGSHKLKDGTNRKLLTEAVQNSILQEASKAITEHPENVTYVLGDLTSSAYLWYFQ